jgi:hypothetical protein
MPVFHTRVHVSQGIANPDGRLRDGCQRPVRAWPHGTTDSRKGPDTGRKPSDDYDPGEPGMWGEPYEMIDDVEGEDDDDD